MSYALGLWVARSLSFGLLYKAGRAWDLSVSGACLSSLAIGLSPILGYAYEGIGRGCPHLATRFLVMDAGQKVSDWGLPLGFS